MQERLFTIHQVAELLGASPREVLEWIRRDWLVSQQLPDGPVRVSERALVGFLKDRGIDLGQLMTSTAAESDERAIGESVAPGGAPPRPETPDAVPVTATQEEAGNDLAIRQMLTGDRALPTAQPDAEEASPAGPVEEPPVAVEAAGPRQAEETQAPQGAQEADMTQEPDITQEAASVSAGEASAVTEAAGDKASQVAGAILADAVAQAASHIHLETPAEGLTLRLRVDGALRDKPNFRRRLPDGLAARLVERLLQWAGVSEVGAARARCGRFSQTIDGREVAFELSAVPTTGGARLVISVHDREVPLPGLSQLHLPEEALGHLERIFSAGDGGLVLVAAPGMKASWPVLRALVVAMRDPGRCVLTVGTAGGAEIDGVGRSRIDPFEGWTFPAAARALSEQNADGIVIEQLRDPVTATAALEAALAGGMVLGGLRAATAPAGLTLLAEMELEPWPLASAVEAVLVARSVRKLCDACRREVETPDELPARIGIPREQLGPKLHGPVGCERCGNTGYAGTIPLTSMLIPDAAVVRLIRNRGTFEALDAACRSAGCADLAELAARQLRAGATSLDEIARVL